MPERVDKETRSRIMASVRSSNTTMERAARPILEALGFEHQPRGVHGRPDFANRGARVAVFLDGCFWHGCPLHYKEPETSTEFWRAKVERNRARDHDVTARLKAEGWRVIRAWEHEFQGRMKSEHTSRNAYRPHHSTKGVSSRDESTQKRGSTQPVFRASVNSRLK